MLGPDKIGDEFAITNFNSGEYQSFLVPTPDGGFEITWVKPLTDGVTEIFVQTFDTSGVATSEKRAIADGGPAAESPDDQSMTLLSDGSTVVTWVQDGEGQKSDIYHTVVGRVITADGHTIDFDIADWVQDPIDLYASQSVVALSDNNFAVTWQAIDPKRGWTTIESGVFHYDSSSETVSTVGAPFELNGSASTQDAVRTSSMPTTAALPDGGYVAVWVGSPDTTINSASLTGPDSIHLSVVDGSGNILLADTDIAKASTLADGSKLDHIRPSVAVLDNGNFVVTWEDLVTAPDHSVQSTTIKAELFDSAGQPVGQAFTVNPPTTDGVSEPSVAALKDGSFVVTWTDHNGTDDVYNIMGQEFHADGQTAGDAFMVNDPQSSGEGPANYASSVTGLDNGGFVVSWTSGAFYPPTQDDTNPQADIHAQVFAPAPVEVTDGCGEPALPGSDGTSDDSGDHDHYSPQEHAADGVEESAVTAGGGENHHQHRHHHLAAVRDGGHSAFNHYSSHGCTATDRQIAGACHHALAQGTHTALDIPDELYGIRHAGKAEDLLARYNHDVQQHCAPPGHEYHTAMDAHYPPVWDDGTYHIG